MISQRTLTRALIGTFGAFAALAPTPDANAQLPTPKDLVSGLDLECFRTPGPPLNLNINLTHLNPVLLNLGMQPFQATVHELAQTCVPVRKNNAWPDPAALPFIRHVDFACYRIDANPVAVPLNLTHLNPELAGQPQQNVTLERPVQLCVPVAKNNTPPPPEVRAFVRYIDLACYELDAPPYPDFTLALSQLNPQLQGIAAHNMTLTESRQLCVPVRKNAQVIPPEALALIRWIDLLKLKASPVVTIAPVNVLLHHLNPLFVNLAPVPVVLEEANSLMVPVAKNGAIPPND